MKKRLLAIALFVFMLAALMPGCAQNPAAGTPDTAAETPADAEASAAPAENSGESADSSGEPAVEETPGAPEQSALNLTDEYSVLNALKQVPQTNVYPIEGELHAFSMWTPFQNQNGIVNGYNDYPFVPVLQEATNVRIEFRESPNSSASEQFNLIVASDEYPDLFRNFTAWYSSGAAAAYEEDVIIDLTDLVEQYMPNYKYCIGLHETDLKNTTTSDGKILYLSAVVQYEAIGFGNSIRKDWLDAVGLEAPHTVQALEDTLVAFKSELGVKAPLDINSGNYASSLITTAYDTLGVSFYQKDNKVIFGAITDEFKDYLLTMNKWYKLDLFSQDFMSITDNPRDPVFTEMILGGKTGVFNGRAADLDSHIAGNSDPKADYVGLKPIVIEEGNLNHFYDIPRTVNNGTIAVSSQCEDVETAAVWMDYMYSYAGAVLLGYGVEGESYNLIDGSPVYDYAYTAQFAADHGWDNMRFANALYYNPVNDWFGLRPYMIDPNISQTVKNAQALWNDRSLYSDDNWRIVDGTLTYTQEENEERATLYSDISTYVSETVAKFVTGELDIEAEWPTYVSTIEDMNVAGVLAITQAAYDRYHNR